jgi:hypothetical protein
MIRGLLRYYKPKIQFRVGQKKLPQVKVENEEEMPVSYEKPSYLNNRKILSDEEIDLLNQGGRAPAVHWKKVKPLTDISLD